MLESHVRLLETYRLAFGTAPDDLGDYEQVLAELTAGRNGMSRDDGPVMSVRQCGRLCRAVRWRLS